MSQRIGISMGDAAGVGPELACKICSDPAFTEHELIVYGNQRMLERVAEHCDIEIPKQIKEIACKNIESIKPGEINRDAGQLASDCIDAAIQDCMDKKIDAMVTCPIHKQALALAGSPFPGHTEILQDRCQADDSYMLLYDKKICVALATCHQSLASVPSSINKHDIVRLGELVHEFLIGIGHEKPQIAVCGLNPHAGEGGLFGDEETIINQAVQSLRDAGIQCSDALPPDSAFAPHMLEQFHAHLCMYHDQALIPFKALAFEYGVNLTLGLPIIRTSVDHGTAFDIAWQGKASPNSLKSAVEVAINLAHRRV